MPWLRVPEFPILSRSMGNVAPDRHNGRDEEQTDCRVPVNSNVEIAIVILLASLCTTVTVLGCGKCLSFAFISASFEQLLAC